MKKYLFSAIIIFLGINFLTAQTKQTEHKTAILGWYNLENLFDTENDPLTNDEQFLPEGSYRWTPERYLRKIENMSKVISLIGKEHGGVVAIGVCEIENRKVLEDLVASDNLKPMNMGIVHYDSPDRRGVDVGFMYNKDRVKVIYSNSHRLYTSDTSFRTRDQLIVSFILDGIDTMHMIVNHWPSKLGGKKSIGSRAAAAQLTRHIADSIMAGNPNAKIVIVGDFNDDPDSKSIITNLKTKKSIKATEPGDLFNPMYKMYKKGYGSYAYRDAWGLIDQSIISYGFLHAQPNTYQYVAAKIFHEPLILQKTQTGSYEDYPYRTYAGGTYQGGYSDHFPVYVIVERK
ncbi:MAG: endonuclease/exonuclease/phosphatase family protein [Bacteroidales bacterium]|nr:endonuclease/exonuclease/phosphatase family protein [Bacteroidales bacterium]